MRSRKLVSATVCTVAVFTGAVAGPMPAAFAYACNGFVQYRTADFQNHATAIGVTAQLTTPNQADVHGYTTSPFYPILGDISLQNDSANPFDFIQLGWYLGTLSNNPYTAVPKLFFGEAVGTGEVMQAGQNLSWGTSYTFKLIITGTGGWHAYMNGNYVFSNSYTHGTLPTAQMNGESDTLCETMDALAIRNPSPPDSTLYYATGSASSPTWTLFSDSIIANSAVTNQNASSPNTFTYGKVNSDAGNFYALGGG
jgi:hypothetical protein